MLEIFKSAEDLDITRLLGVYRESLRSDGETIQFQRYVQSVFFGQPDAFYAVWMENDQYVSALRCEVFADGYLITGLETAPDQRRKGYGSRLLQAVADCLLNVEKKLIYSHIHRNNCASLQLHYNCGFIRKTDYAHLLDGTVSANYITLIKC